MIRCALGTGWKKEDLGKVQVMVKALTVTVIREADIWILVEEVEKGIAEEGGFGAR